MFELIDHFIEWMKEIYRDKFKKFTIQRIFPYLLIITAVIGLFASFTLTIEHMNILEDPNYNLSCAIDPVLACGPIMASPEATAFGFPNPLIGLVTFGAQLLLGVVMLAGARMRSWFWKLYGLSIAGGMAFTIWLIWHSLYVIGAICIYCLAVWMVMIPTTWYLFQYMLAEKHLRLPNKKLQNFIRRHHGDFLISFYIILIALILIRFWYYYGPKLGL